MGEGGVREEGREEHNEAAVTLGRSFVSSARASAIGPGPEASSSEQFSLPRSLSLSLFQCA
eukprot:8536097-Pyramimonas_sp.AAC.1